MVTLGCHDVFANDYTTSIMDFLVKRTYRIISTGLFLQLFLYYIMMIILLELLEFRWVCPPR